MSRVYLFKRFERFWHWSQAALIVSLMLTGFEIHGVYSLFGFEAAVRSHGWLAWALVTLWLFAIFWHFTTGEWRQYLPTWDRLVPIARYYALGIFKGESHPYHPTPQRKHNPLQRLAYLLLKLLINPLIWISGLLYLYYPYWRDSAWLGALPLSWVAIAHTAGAFMMLIFFIAHVYLATTGRTPLTYIKAMITGWEEIGDDSSPAANSPNPERSPG